MKFNEIIVSNVVKKLVLGDDYRDEIINAINLQFLDFALDFFRKILNAKLVNNELNLKWYKDNFINNKKVKSDEIAIFAGINKKTIGNIYGSATKEIILEEANNNIHYLEHLLNSLKNNSQLVGVCIKISHNNISVELNLSESLLIINALATKKNSFTWKRLE